MRGWVVVSVALMGAMALAQDAPLVKVDGGVISGQLVSDPSGSMAVFRGVPFAAPPMGDLRWRPPRPVTPWQGTRRCVAFGPACPQPRQELVGRTPERMSEDCLYLNVWGPPPSKQEGSTRPVMVWIHGGGFTTGAGSLPYYDGRKLAAKGVVVVTINYRLGPFGFLAHPLLSRESERNVSGNYGLLDQIAALEWVRRNIAAFGGDKDRVTIFGESAGAVSVCRLMTSPLAEGLFHRAIAQSGGARGLNRFLRETRNGLAPMEKVGEEVEKRLGCEGAADRLAAMRAKSAEEVLAAANAAQGLFGRGTKYGPVVDGWVLPEPADEAFAAGRQHPVPMIVGSNADEGTIFLRQINVSRRIGYLIVMRSIFGKRSQEAMRLFPVASDADVRQALNEVVTVSSFVAPARALARDMAAKGLPAYLYHLTRVAPSVARLKMGAFHGLDVAYVFGNGSRGFAAGEEDRALTAEIMTRWARFAATGDPNGPGLTSWPAYSPDEDAYLEFGDTVKVKRGLWKEACDLFDRVAAER